jgi:hypothetical protein
MPQKVFGPISAFLDENWSTVGVGELHLSLIALARLSARRGRRRGKVSTLLI